MMLDLTSFDRALKQLHRSLDYLNSEAARADPSLAEQFRSASIQAFEYSYELSIKMIRRQLSQIVANPQTLVQVSFADLIRMAADAGLVSDVKRFTIYRDARNQTSHTYEEQSAADIIRIVPDFFKDASLLLEQLRKRNS
jgi:nucleotidyltransferase substrate binding protein (TIGR01987 family)